MFIRGVLHLSVKIRITGGESNRILAIPSTRLSIVITGTVILQANFTVPLASGVLEAVAVARAALGQEALVRWPDEAVLWEVLSHVHLQEGTNPEATEAALLRVLHIEPDNQSARNNLALFQRRRAPALH